MDWNSDGRKDLISGDTKGQVWLFINEGTVGNPALAKGVRISAAGKPIEGVRARYEKGKDGQFRVVPNKTDLIGVYSKLNFADFDGDGLRDLLIGQDGPGGQYLVWYKNTGNAKAPAFAAPKEMKVPRPMVGRPSPYLCDLDRDGKLDMLYGCESPAVYFSQNKGTAKEPVWSEPQKLDLSGDGFDAGYRCRIDVVDWDNDGKLDILVGNTTRPSAGNVWLFRGK